MNSLILEQFKLLIKQIKLDMNMSTGKKKLINLYRLNSIQNSLDVLEKYPKKIKNIDDIKNIKGIGKGTLSRVKEILDTGKLSEINLPDNINFIDELEKIYGIGKKTAYDLFKKHNIKSIEELKKKYSNNEIELPENIIKGLKYYGKINTNINRENIDEISSFLSKTLLEIDKDLFGIVCGSYRRLKLTSGDIDFIIIDPKCNTKNDTDNSNVLYTLITKLKKHNFIQESLTDDNVKTKYMGICKWKKEKFMRIDIRFIPYESYYTSILYFTGSKNFNKKMRKIALILGYTLNEYGLYDENNKMIHVNSEKEIFDILGMEYLDPSNRI